MRFLPFVLLAFAMVSPSAAAYDPSYNAGSKRISVQDSDPFKVMLAYPTMTPEQNVQAGPFTLSISPDAIAAEAPALCNDTPDVDRTKTHPEIKRHVSEFFRKNL